MNNRFKSVSVFLMVLLFSGGSIKTYADNVASNEATVTQTSSGTVDNTTGSAVKLNTGSATEQNNNQNNDTSTQVNNVENTTPTNVEDTGTTSNNTNGIETTIPNTTEAPTDTIITGTTPVTVDTVPITTAPSLQPDTLEAPTISVSISTNSLNLGNVNDVSENSLPNVSITVQSNSKYQLSVKGTDDFKGDDTSHTMSIEHLKVKLEGEKSFKNMKKTQVVLADNEPITDSKTYHVEFKLNPDWQVKAGKYGTTVTFEVEAIK